MVLGRQEIHLESEKIARELSTLHHRITTLARNAQTAHQPTPESQPQTSAELDRLMADLEAAHARIAANHEEMTAQLSALEAENQHYRALFEMAPDGYLVTDVDGVIQEANRAAGLLFHTNPQVLVGKPIWVYLPDGTRHQFLEKLSGLLQTAVYRAEGWELSLQPRYGAPVSVAVTVGAGHNPITKGVQFHWSLRDVSARSQAEAEVRVLNTELEQRVMTRAAQLVTALRHKDELLTREQAARAKAEAAERYRAFLAETSLLLSASLDYEETVQRVARLAVPTFADWSVVWLLEQENRLAPAAVAHIDPDAVALVQELLRHYPPDLHEPGALTDALKHGHVVVQQAITAEELQAIARDEAHLQLMQRVGYHAFMVVPMITRGQVLGALMFVVKQSDAGLDFPGDVPDSRHFGAEAVALAEDFSHRAALAIDNALRHEELLDAIRTRDFFLSVASHELRTPITTVQGYAQLLQRRMAMDSTFTRRDEQMLRTVYEESQRLNQMIELLLDLSRLQSGQLYIEHGLVNMCALSRRLANLVEPMLENHTLTLNCPDYPLWVEGDELRLEQVFRNLINNAVKYSPGGGVITLEVIGNEPDVLIAISDQGVGIPVEALSRLFDRYYRAKNVEAHKIGGFGIGLYVVKELVSLHGGAIEVTSEEGMGSTFTVRLPMIGGE